MFEKLIYRKVATSMIFLGICLIGIISLRNLPVQLLPDIEFPRLTVVTPYENAAPSEVEQLITKYIEEAVSSVNGVISVYSESIEGISMVTARFKWGTDIDMALIETKEKVDIIKGQLPEDTGKSVVVKFDPKADPVMIFTIVNKSGDFPKLRKQVEKEIIPYIERIDGVAVVDLNGGYHRQINVDLDIAKIFSHNLSFQEIMENVNLSNYNFPAGNIEKGNMEYLVRTLGEFSDIGEINNVVIGRNEAGIPVYLKDVGTVEDGYRDKRCIIQLNGSESIGLLIRKEPGKNTIETCEKVDEKFDELMSRHDDFAIIKIYDQSIFIKNAVNNVFISALLGGVIAFFILLFFLKELKSPVIIATSIPISILGTFALMYFKGISINTMSLGGLALGVGMMVDAGIVVLEAISKNKDENTGIFKSVINGIREIKSAVIASTVTSIVVFLPIIFLSGLSGAMFGELALTISFALICSLLASLLLMPMLYTVTGKTKTSLNSNSAPFGLNRRFFSISDKIMDYLIRVYNKMIRSALKNKAKIFALGILVFISGGILFMMLDFQLMPGIDPGEFSINIETPKGTTLNESSALCNNLETYLLNKSNIKYVYSKIGSDPEENIAERISGRSTNDIVISVILSPKRNVSTRSLVESLKKELRFGENVKTDYKIKENVIESIFAGNIKPLTIEVYGQDKEELTLLGRKIKDIISGIEGVQDISATLDHGYPELKLNVDRNKMAVLGVNIYNIASTVRAAIKGEIVSKYREKDDEIDIRVRLRKQDRTEREMIYKILVKTKSEMCVPIEKFISIDEGFSTSKIIRSEQSRVNVVTGNILSNKTKIIDEVKKIISDIELKEGYELKIAGENREIENTLNEMKFAFILAIVLIYMVLASQFQSFKNPLIIMLSIPIALIGISGLLLITGQTLNINSSIGIIMLCGIVVNNAIVLFNVIDDERKRGQDLLQAVIEAGRKRLKPIIMTTATTVFALLPIAFGIGEGAELQQPLAIAVIGGLLVSTLLTLGNL
ncbi:MAG: efflux RND transporter permease subunit [Spirochaetes bacterium]|nr:efflux RND transporter permease subunit [Spirochaetota bacterium]